MREYHHCGAVRQPFPDVALCLSTIWLLSRSGPDCGGTFIVPGSHRDPRNPRSTVDGIDGYSPIPGELQVTAPAGSVFIQDSRTWHSSAHNPSLEPRVAMVARYCPWWVTAEFGWGDGAQEWVPRPVFERMGPALQALVRHRTCGVPDALQPAKLAATSLAAAKSAADIAAAAPGANASEPAVVVPFPAVRFDRAAQTAAQSDSQSIGSHLSSLSSHGYCVVDAVFTSAELEPLLSATRQSGDLISNGQAARCTLHYPMYCGRFQRHR